jgi:uncharacterized radical SAM superfamily Fe-S cluster-containing enzyme
MLKIEVTGMEKKIPIKSPSTASQMIDEEAVVIVPSDQMVNVLNSVGCRIWDLADGKRSIAEIANILTQEREGRGIGMPNPYARILKKTQDRLIPFMVHWELTYRCNLRCPHCYVVPQNSREELTSGEIAHILDVLKERGTLYVIFSGGEILTRKDFFEVAREARKKGTSIH